MIGDNMNTNKKYGGKLKNCTMPLLGIWVWGNLYDDPNKRWEDGKQVRTSAVVAIDEENKKIETLNTIYDYEVADYGTP